jgi:hypothetical protein
MLSDKVLPRDSPKSPFHLPTLEISMTLQTVNQLFDIPLELGIGHQNQESDGEALIKGLSKCRTHANN